MPISGNMSPEGDAKADEPGPSTRPSQRLSEPVPKLTCSKSDADILFAMYGAAKDGLDFLSKATKDGNCGTISGVLSMTQELSRFLNLMVDAISGTIAKVPHYATGYEEVLKYFGMMQNHLIDLETQLLSLLQRIKVLQKKVENRNVLETFDDIFKKQLVFTEFRIDVLRASEFWGSLVHYLAELTETNMVNGNSLKPQQPALKNFDGFAMMCSRCKQLMEIFKQILRNGKKVEPDLVLDLAAIKIENDLEEEIEKKM